MKQKHSKIIIGSAIGLATLAVAIDHTRHRLPETEAHRIEVTAGAQTPCIPDSPCSIYDTPCSLDSPCSIDSPCSMHDNPCALDSPCSMYENPCSMDSPCSIYDKPCGPEDSATPCAQG